MLDILADIAPDEDLSNLKDDVPFREQLELDSMDFLDIVMELRKRYRIQIPEEDYAELASMASTVEYLEPRMKDMAKKCVAVAIARIAVASAIRRSPDHVPCTTRSSSAPACRAWRPASAWPTSTSASAFSNGTRRSAG